MSMRPSLYATRESPARRIGVILSILFLTSLGTVATLTSAPAGAQANGDTPIPITTQPFATAL
jgi:hypothetical protein